MQRGDRPMQGPLSDRARTGVDNLASLPTCGAWARSPPCFQGPLCHVSLTLWTGLPSLGLTGGPGPRRPETPLLRQVKLGVIKSLKPMLNLLLPNDDLREQVYDYIPLLLAEYQGNLEAFFITQVGASWGGTWAGGLAPPQYLWGCTIQVEAGEMSDSLTSGSRPNICAL